MGNGTSKKGGAPVTQPQATGPRSVQDSIKKIEDIGFIVSGRAEAGLKALGDQYAQEVADMLESLEATYGAHAVHQKARGDVGMKFQAEDLGKSMYAAVWSNKYSGVANIIGFNTRFDYDAKNAAYKKEVADKWKMPSNLTGVQYTAAHEYGHMLQFSMMVKSGYNGTSGQFAAGQKKTIMSIAKKKYGATAADLSSYGATNSHEFFAEAFANAVGGSPNAVGKAMTDWLKTQGF